MCKYISYCCLVDDDLWEFLKEFDYNFILKHVCDYMTARTHIIRMLFYIEKKNKVWVSSIPSFPFLFDCVLYRFICLAGDETIINVKTTWPILSHFRSNVNFSLSDCLWQANFRLPSNMRVGQQDCFFLRQLFGSLCCWVRPQLPPSQSFFVRWRCLHYWRCHLSC